MNRNQDFQGKEDILLPNNKVNPEVIRKYQKVYKRKINPLILNDPALYQKSYLEQIYEKKVLAEENKRQEELRIYQEQRELERLKNLFLRQYEEDDIEEELQNNQGENDNQFQDQDFEQENNNSQLDIDNENDIGDDQKEQQNGKQQKSPPKSPNIDPLLHNYKVKLNYFDQIIEKEGKNIEKNQQNYYFQRLKPWQIYLKKKVNELVKVERKYKPEDLKKKADENYYLKKLLKFREKVDLSFLDKPVDECMQMQFFKKNDLLMKFYERKYRFEMKEVRPFGHHTRIKELNPLYNEKVYESEMNKFLNEQGAIKKEQDRRYFQILKNIDNASFSQPLQKICKNNSFMLESKRSQSITSDTFNLPSTTKNLSMLEKYPPPELDTFRSDFSQTLTGKNRLRTNGDLILDQSNPHFLTQQQSHSRNLESINCQTTRTTSTLNIFPKTLQSTNSEFTKQLLNKSQLSQKVTDYISQQDNKVDKTLTKMKRMITKRNFNKTVLEKGFNKDLIYNNNDQIGTFDLSSSDIFNIELDPKITQIGSQKLNETTKKWHANELKQITTELQLKELRAQRFKNPV